jgi:hypothetical protein
VEAGIPISGDRCVECERDMRQRIEQFLCARLATALGGRAASARSGPRAYHGMQGARTKRAIESCDLPKLRDVVADRAGGTESPNARCLLNTRSGLPFSSFLFGPFRREGEYSWTQRGSRVCLRWES